MTAVSLVETWWRELLHRERVDRESKETAAARLPVFARGGYHPWSAVAGVMTPIKMFDWKLMLKKVTMHEAQDK